MKTILAKVKVSFSAEKCNYLNIFVLLLLTLETIEESWGLKCKKIYMILMESTEINVNFTGKKQHIHH